MKSRLGAESLFLFSLLLSKASRQCQLNLSRGEDGFKFS